MYISVYDLQENLARSGRLLALIGDELLNRSTDRIVSLRIVLLEPEPGIGVPVYSHIGDNAGPIESGRALVAALRVWQIKAGLDNVVANFGRWTIRRIRNRMANLRAISCG